MNSEADSIYIPAVAVEQIVLELAQRCQAGSSLKGCVYYTLYKGGGAPPLAVSSGRLALTTASLPLRLLKPVPYYMQRPVWLTAPCSASYVTLPGTRWEVFLNHYWKSI